MGVWAWRDVYLDLRVGVGEVVQDMRAEEIAEIRVSTFDLDIKNGDGLHAPGATPVVAVVEIETFALQDECADAILVVFSILMDKILGRKRT